MRSLLIIVVATLIALSASAQCPGADLALCGADANGCAEPLLIKLNDGPWKLAGMDDAVSFDINASGHPRSIGWTVRGDETTAFLALDRNHNNVIDDGSELFGTASLMSNGSRAANGFQAMERYDLNLDAVIDHADPVWNSLLLWVDVNHDGVSQPSELSPFSESSVTAIELPHHWSGRHDENGNTFAYEGKIRIDRRARAIYDVFFVTERRP
jgi:trimeric autotransporter adhesin